MKARRTSTAVPRLELCEKKKTKKFYRKKISCAWNISRDVYISWLFSRFAPFVFVCHTCRVQHVLYHILWHILISEWMQTLFLSLLLLAVEVNVPMPGHVFNPEHIFIHSVSSNTNIQTSNIEYMYIALKIYYSYIFKDQTNKNDQKWVSGICYTIREKRSKK